MKNKLIIAAVAVLGVTTAYAGERMKNADTDSDGLISLAEFETAKTARIAEQFARMDKNADGYLSADEMQNSRRGDHKKGRKGQHRGNMDPEKMLTRLDKNGSGTVTFDELQGKRFSPDNDAFVAADADNNGELNAAELEAMMKARWSERHSAERSKND